jgi:NAD(P)-dependent dehydrogenase (short-subunit alcohol dehydrogenase family)
VAIAASDLKDVVFFCIDDSSYITGTELFVDGGFVQI